MNITLYLSFLLISVILIIVPGPNVLVIVSTSLAHGMRRGLQTVAGTSSAMVIQLLIVGVCTTWFVRLVADGLYYLKWLGVAYLLYLGLKHLKAAVKSAEAKIEISAASTFRRGFLVSLMNPKTLLFFSAFLPQFVSGKESYHLQIFLLAASFVILATMLDSCYALLSSRLRFLIRNRYFGKVQHGFSGVLFLGASTWLAATKH